MKDDLLADWVFLRCHDGQRTEGYTVSMKVLPRIDDLASREDEADEAEDDSSGRVDGE